MKLGEWAVGIMIVMMMVVGFGWQATRIDKLKSERDSLSEKLLSQRAVNNITLSAVAINHRASLNNINAKQVEGIEHVKVKTVIKTVFKDSECAAVPVPADAVSELQKYATGIRARAGGSDTGSSDR